MLQGSLLALVNQSRTKIVKHHKPWSTTSAEGFLSTYDSILHVTRDPIDVVLGFIESGITPVDPQTHRAHTLQSPATWPSHKATLPTRWSNLNVAWLLVHSDNMYGGTPISKEIKQALRSRGLLSLVDSDLFNIENHTAMWHAQQDRPTIEIKYEAISSPEVARALQLFFCLPRPYQPPDRNKLFAGPWNNIASSKEV
mgnify:CR=1 FL=1